MNLNSGRPFINRKEDIKNLTSPDVKEVKSLEKIFTTIGDLKAEVQDDASIIGVVLSPFSVPIMQMGFENYIKLIYEDRELFNILMDVNQELCVNYANAQLEAGATAICY